MKIKVKCVMGFQVYNMDKTNLLAEVEEGKVYEATVSDYTAEFFAFDAEGRKFFVGELDWYDLVLSEYFELVSEAPTHYDIDTYWAEMEE